jgi:hypothetical protein
VTAPVNTDDLVAGCVKYLLGLPDVLAVLGKSPTNAVPYLYQHQLYATIQNTQSNAAVIIRSGGWAAPNVHNSMRFPRLGLEITSDQMRDDGNNPILPGEVLRRIDVVYRALDAHLHRPQSGEQYWGTVRVIACTRLAEPSVYALGGGLWRLATSYGVSEG